MSNKGIVKDRYDDGRGNVAVELLDGTIIKIRVNGPDPACVVLLPRTTPGPTVWLYPSEQPQNVVALPQSVIRMLGLSAA